MHEYIITKYTTNCIKYVTIQECIVMIWMCVSLKNLYFEILMPKVIVLGMGRHLGSA